MAILRFLCYLLLVRPSFVNPCSDHNQPTGRRPTRWRSCENFVAARKFAQVAVQRSKLSLHCKLSEFCCGENILSDELIEFFGAGVTRDDECRKRAASLAGQFVAMCSGDFLD